MPPTVAVVTLGCPKNEADSARLLTLLARRFEISDDPSAADAVVINTCGFLEAAARESLETVFEAASLPQRPLVAAVGCLASRYRDELAAALPEAGLVVGLERLGELDSLLEEALTGRAAAGSRRRDLWAIPPTVAGPTAYLTVSDGCDRRCSYCAIPAIRGRYRSRLPGDVLGEAEALVEQGVRELVLVGQDVGSYGKHVGPDTAGAWGLARLLRSLGERVGSRTWIRAMYLQPGAVTLDLLAAVATSPGVVPYFDVPIQHVDSAVLRAMRRSGDADRFARLAARIRARVPGAVLRTTVMCAFPGETASAFERLEMFVAQGHFDYTGVFAYSREAGTPAAALAGRVRRDVATRRRERLESAAAAAWERRAQAYVGTVVDVLVEGRSDDPSWEWMGRSEAQAPDVDGIVYWSGPQLGDSSSPDPGSFAQVRVERVVGYDLEGAALT